MQWAEFWRIFVDRYYPITYKYLMQRRFFELKQGSMSVNQYLDEFTKLSQYASHMVTDEKEKTQWFVDGPHTSLHRYIDPLGIEVFTKAVDIATH